MTENENSENSKFWMLPYSFSVMSGKRPYCHQSALGKVENGLAASKAVNKVYRIDIPGKEESAFGVALVDGEGADQTVMAATDTGDLRHTPHLPYELLVSGNKVYILHGKFRIAQSFPDLGMGTFMKISGAPNAIAETITGAIE